MCTMLFVFLFVSRKKQTHYLIYTTDTLIRTCNYIIKNVLVVHFYHNAREYLICQHEHEQISDSYPVYLHI